MLEAVTKIFPHTVITKQVTGTCMLEHIIHSSSSLPQFNGEDGSWHFCVDYVRVTVLE